MEWSKRDLNLAILCFDGYGHIVPAYLFATRLVELIKKRRQRSVACHDKLRGFYEVEGKQKIVIFCQVSRSDLPTLVKTITPTEEVELLVRIIEDDAEMPRLESPADVEARVGPSPKGMLSVRGQIFRQDCMKGLWTRRVVAFYTRGFDKVHPRTLLTQRYYSCRLDGDNITDYWYFTRTPKLTAETTPACIPRCILADMFIPYDGEVATELGRVSGYRIPCWSFHPSSAVTAGFDYVHASLDIYGLDIKFDDSDLMEGSCASGGHGFLAEAERRPHREGIIINDIEDWYNYDILESVRRASNPSWKLCCVGPLQFGYPQIVDKETPRIIEQIPSNASILYIAMGSQFIPSEEKLAEIADIIRNRAEDVCVIAIRDHSTREWLESMSKSEQESAYSYYPDERTCFPDERKRFFISWIDQVTFMRRCGSRIRRFVSHCGWNSVLEAFTLTDAKLICMPLGAEQGINAKCVQQYFAKDGQGSFQSLAKCAYANSSMRNMYRFLDSLLKLEKLPANENLNELD